MKNLSAQTSQLLAEDAGQFSGNRALVNELRRELIAPICYLVCGADHGLKHVSVPPSGHSAHPGADAHWQRPGRIACCQAGQGGTEVTHSIPSGQQGKCWGRVCGPPQHLRCVVRFDCYHATMVEYHWFQASLSCIPASPHEGSARVRWRLR